MNILLLNLEIGLTVHVQRVLIFVTNKTLKTFIDFH